MAFKSIKVKSMWQSLKSIMVTYLTITVSSVCFARIDSVTFPQYLEVLYHLDSVLLRNRERAESTLLFIPLGRQARPQKTLLSPQKDLAYTSTWIPFLVHNTFLFCIKADVCCNYISDCTCSIGSVAGAYRQLIDIVLQPLSFSRHGKDLLSLFYTNYFCIQFS